jgi:hypothetical protein
MYSLSGKHGPYVAAARNITITIAGTGSGSVTICVSSGTVTWSSSGSCTGSGRGTASATISSTCTTLASSDKNAAVTLTATANGVSFFGGWSNGSVPSNKEIAHLLGLSLNSVKGYMKLLMRKLGVGSRTGIVASFLERG